MKFKLPLLAACAIGPVAALHAADKPNIVYILCDDLGYGDVKCLGGDRSKILTPNMDRIASQGDDFHRSAFQLCCLHSKSLQHLDRTL